MPKRILALSKVAVPAIGTAAVAFFSLASTSSESMLRSSFDKALERGSVRALAGQRADTAPISGSEDFWLTASLPGAAGLISNSVAVGDRVTLNLGGEERRLEIADIAEIRPAINQIGTKADANRLLLVTARDTASDEPSDIQFLMRVPSSSRTVSRGQSGRTL